MTVWQHSTSTNTSALACRQTDIIKMIRFSLQFPEQMLLQLCPYAFAVGILTCWAYLGANNIQNALKFQKQFNNNAKYFC